MGKWIVLLLAIIWAASSRGQGCSDAGVCTAGALRQDVVKESGSRNRVSLSTSIGWGDDNVFVVTPALQYSFQPAKSLEIQAKISANRACGRLGSVTGPGDVLLNAVKLVKMDSNTNVSFVAGLKLPMSSGNLTIEGRALPMQYQSSLGTYDAILGATFSYRKWQFGFGYQQPLSGANENMYSAMAWPGYKVDAYPQSYRLYRRADVIAKAACNIISLERWQIIPGVLVVFHTGEDRYTNTSTMHTEAIKGSDGFTVNLTLNVSYSTPKFTFSMLAGRPVIVRSLRPDGLTRSLALLPEISYKF